MLVAIFLMIGFGMAEKKKPSEALNLKEHKRTLYKPIGDYQVKGVTALYRISSGEVIKISKKGQTFSKANSLFYGVLINPELPDGIELPKIAIPESNIIRNGTQTEIDNCYVLKEQDTNKEHCNDSIRRLNNDPQFRMFAKAMTSLMTKEFNQTRGEDGRDLLTEEQVWNALQNEYSHNH